MRVQPPPPVEARAAERKSVGITAQLREFGGTRMDVEVHDLSRTGFLTSCVFNVPVGARVYLTLPSFSAFEAVVAWRDKKGFGCRFDQPLHPAVFDMIVARHRNS